MSIQRFSQKGQKDICYNNLESHENESSRSRRSWSFKQFGDFNLKITAMLSTENRKKLRRPGNVAMLMLVAHYCYHLIARKTSQNECREKKKYFNYLSSRSCPPLRSDHRRSKESEKFDETLLLIDSED